MQNAKITKIYHLSVLFFTLSALIMFTGNLEHMKWVYKIQNEAKKSTGFLESKENRKEDLPKITWTHGTGNTVLPKRWIVLKNAIDAQEKHTIMLKSLNDEKLLKQYVMNVDLKNKKKTQDWVTEILYEKIKHLGYRKDPTVSLIQSCKNWAIYPSKCILIWLTLMYNEAGNMQNSKACTTRNNCFGIRSGKAVYSSLEEATDTWVVKYNKHWKNAKDASFFYSSAWKVSPSRYCTSESSSNTNVGCPMWLKIATKKWNQLEKIIY